MSIYIPSRLEKKRDITVTPGTNSVATLPSGEKVATFTVSGTLTVS